MKALNTLIILAAIATPMVANASESDFAVTVCKTKNQCNETSIRVSSYAEYLQKYNKPMPPRIFYNTNEQINEFHLIYPQETIVLTQIK